MRIGYWLAGLAAVATLLPGCGEGSGSAEADRAAPKPAATTSTASAGLNRSPCQGPSKRAPRVSLDGHAGAENAGFLVAKERGFFADMGIRPRMLSPSRRNLPVSYIV